MADYNTREAGLTDEQVVQMRTSELKDELRRRRLRLAGRQRELVERLLAALRVEREHGAREDDPEDDNDDDSEEDDDDDEISVVGDRLDVNSPGNRNLNRQDDGVRVTPVLRRSRQDEPRCMLLTFRDVEDSLEKFSGDGLPSVSRWIEDFEEMAKVCGWSDIHMVAFAKKLLTGSAQSVVKRERCTKSWIKLREALKDEFEDAVSDQQIHQELANRMKRPDESLQQYMNSMREIAGQGTVDIPSQISYIVQGIPDEVANKAVLYGAKTMQQLKERLKQYEAMRRDMKAKTNCGSADHLSAKCPEKGKGMKCFKCNEFGHVAANCTARQVKTYVISRPERKKYLKDVSIYGCKFVSLVDTGSDLTFIRSDESARLGSPPLGNYKLRFDGFGSAGNSTWGEFTKVMTRHSLLLGTDFLDQVELRVKRGEVTFLRLDGQTDGHEDAPDVLRVNAIEQTDEIDLSHVREPHYREAIRDIIKGYRPEKKRDVGITAKIVPKSDKPVARRPRRLAPSERKEVDDLMEAWTNEGVIKPSDSEYTSPIVVVRKKDGSIRVCVNFRELNELIEWPHFPLSLIEDVLDTLQGAQLFTTIDLKNGFFHVSLDKDSQKTIHNDHTKYQCCREALNISRSASVPLRTNEDFDAGMEYLNSNIINTIRSTTPDEESATKQDYPDSIKRKITERHKLRRISEGNREARGNVG
ncbi:uncharacterized protein LOC117213423 [Bombus bifarius]|uniref:Uncharacterized protein LOC117213423 n=1 Tax=Bombus bifarius TaxID=103933 RepID=A0A6P8N1T2_9HYME|nr:uncharacterized protein LOC117213423 [Bombus bifarius]